MSIGYLYVTTNDVNGMAYVGQSRNLEKRAIDTYLGSGDYLKSAIRELGVERFAKSIVGYFEDAADLDYAEVHAIAKLRALDIQLYNAGVGGPRAHAAFVRSMFQTFGVIPTMETEWFAVVDANRDEVVRLLAAGNDLGTDAFYRELEAQFQQSQDLSTSCPRCCSVAGAVCRTKTGKPAKNHAGRGGS